MARSSGAIEVFASAPAVAPDTKLTRTAKLVFMSEMENFVLKIQKRISLNVILTRISLMDVCVIFV